MKSFSSAFFSLLFVFSFYASVGFAETQEACKATCNAKFGSEGKDKIEGCYTTSGCYDLDSKKDLQNSCNAAEKDYGSSREKNPCPGSNAVACEEKIKSCMDSSQAAFSASPGSEEGLDGMVNVGLGLLGASQSKEQNSAENFNIDASCYSFATKTAKEKLKERQERIDKIKKEIREETKNQNTINKEFDKEKQEIAEEQRKLQAELKKFILKMDVTKRERATESSKNLQKSMADVRNLNSDLMKLKQDKEKAAFQHRNTLLAYTEDKINKQCKSALEIAKTCFVKSSKGQPIEKNDTCANFSFSGKGAKGTAALKEKLLQVRDACFEQSNQTVSTVKFDYAQAMQNADRAIEEKNKQIEDANNAIELNKKDFEAIAKESETEKTQEEQSVMEQIANLQTKLADLTKQTNKAIEDSKAIIADLQKELNEVTAGKLASDLGIGGGGSIFEDIALDSQNLLDTINQSAARTKSACCRDEIKDNNKAICSQLETSSKKSRSTRRTKPSTER